MCPLNEYICTGCAHIFETINKWSPELKEKKEECPHCNTLTGEYLPSAHGGYSMNSGGGSTRPKSAGSFKRTK